MRLTGPEGGPAGHGIKPIAEEGAIGDRKPLPIGDRDHSSLDNRGEERDDRVDNRGGVAGLDAMLANSACEKGGPWQQASSC